MKRKTRTTAHQAALQAYEKSIMRLLKMAEELPDLIRDAYPAPNEDSPNIHWGLVGTINHLWDEVKNIRDQITGEGEYAR
jgi:hypothetical protein